MGGILYLCEATEGKSGFYCGSENGEVIIGYHGKDRDFNLNSTYNPSKEAEKLMAEYDTIPDNAFLCMYGLANGIFAKRF